MPIKIPYAAMPVVRVLRRDVRKPSKRSMRSGKVVFFIRNKKRFCPMGLHNKSTVATPYCSSQFAGCECKSLSVASFADGRKWQDNRCGLA